MNNVQKMIITIETPADISEDTFSRLCDAVLLRLLSASLEQRPVQVYGFPCGVHVNIARPIVGHTEQYEEMDIGGR